MPSSVSHGRSIFSFLKETPYCNRKSSHKRKTRGSVVNKNVENNHMDIKVGRRGGMNWEIKINIYINTLLMLCIK